MYRQGVIEEEIWHNWEVGLIHCMNLPAFREAYFKLNAMSAPGALETGCGLEIIAVAHE